MVLVPWNDDLQSNYYVNDQRPVDRDIENASGWGAAFRLENPVVSAYGNMLQPSFQPDPNFDLEERLQTLPPSLNLPESEFIFAQSDAEFDHILIRARREQRDRQILEANGWAGVAQAMIAGTLSPTILLPGGSFVRAARTGQRLRRAVVTGGAWALAGATIDEGILYTTQETRTGNEVLIGIASGTILGGLFGGAAGLLTPRQIARFEADMATGGSPTAIQTYTGGSLSAARTPASELEPDDPGGVLSTGLNAVNDFLSPVSRNLNQTFSRTLRRVQARLNTGGLMLHNNLEGVASNAGGEVASLRLQYYNNMYQTKRLERQLWKEYRREVPSGQRLNLQEFYRAVGRTLAGGPKTGIPQVEKLTKAYRENIYRPMFEEAKRLGMRGFDKVDDEFVDKYMHRVWKKGLLERDKADLQDMLTEHFENSLFEKFSKQYDRLNKMLDRLEEDARLLGMSPEERKAKLDELEAEMARLPENFSDVELDTPAKVDEEVPIEPLTPQERDVLERRAWRDKSTPDNKVDEEDIQKLVETHKGKTNTQLDEEITSEAEVLGIISEPKAAERAMRRILALKAMKQEGRFLNHIDEIPEGNIEFAGNLPEWQRELVQRTLTEFGWNKAVTVRASSGKSAYGSIQPYTKADGTKGVYLNINQEIFTRKKTKAVNTILHEIGHLFHSAAHLQDGMQAKLLAEYVNSFDFKVHPSATGYKPSSVFETAKDRRLDKQNANSWGKAYPDAAENSDIWKYSIRNTTDTPYEYDYAEWFARNVANALEGSATTQGVMQEFFARIAATWRRVQAYLSENGYANDVVKQALNAMRDPTYAQFQMSQTKLLETVQDVAQEIRNLRAAAKGKRGQVATEMRSRANTLESEYADELSEFKKQESALRKQFRTLSQTAAGFAERQRKVLDRIDGIEGQQLNTVDRALRRAMKLSDQLRKGDLKAEADLDKVIDQINAAYNSIYKGDTALERMRDQEKFGELIQTDPEFYDKYKSLEERQAARKQALEELQTRLADLKSGKPVKEIIDRVEEEIANLQRAVTSINNKRALRLEVLRKRADELDPKRAEELQSDLAKRIKEKKLNFLQRIQQGMGGVTSDRAAQGLQFMDEGGNLADEISFKGEARKIAQDVYAAMAGENKVSRGTTQQSLRGPELARTLNVDEFKKWSNGRSFDEFLERDIERVTRQYVRTMSADIELQRAFDTVNPLAEDAPIMTQIKAEFEEEFDRIKNAEHKSVEVRDKKLAKLNREYRQALTDLDIQIQRLRYTRGVPDDPEAMGYRLGRLAMNLNVLRLMGGVVVSSLPDIGSVIMRHGLRTFTDGIVAMARDFKTFKMSAHEAKLAGTALDVALHGRMAAMFDILDEVEYGTKAERGVQALTNKFGMVSLMDVYNSGMQSFAGALINGRMIRALEAVATGRAGPRDAVPYLAANGIDAPLAARMWAEITQTPGGGNSVNGSWLPNTEAWADQDLARSYRAALGRQVQMEIVVPGTERPNWMDKNTFNRVIAQFRSFTFSSQFRIIQAGLQEARIGNYAPVAAGMMTSLAMGAVSYQLWAWANGEETSDDPNVWMNEMINRSGIIGVLAEVKGMAEEIPGLREYATLGANQSTQSRFGDPTGQVFGPTMGILTRDGPNAIAGINPFDDNEMTEGQENALRRLMPYQNLSYAARLFDYLQEQAGPN